MIVLSYNYGRFLADSIGMTLAQRDVDLRVLAVDNGSSDDTLAIAQEFAAKDPRVTVVANETNIGQMPAMNLALSMVETDYVVKLDADDALPPGSLARSVALLDARPDLSFVYGRPLHFKDEVPTVADRISRSSSVWLGADWFEGRCLSSANVISQPEAVMRTDRVRRVGGWLLKYEHTADMCLWLALASIGNVGRVNGSIQGLYRVHPNSLQRTVHAGILADLEGRRDAFNWALDTFGSELPDPERLRAMAQRGLAVTALDRVCRAYDRGRAEREPVDELTAFALSVYGDAQQLPEWRALQDRLTLGRDRVPRHPRFFADAVARRVSDALCYRYWLRTGQW